MESVLIRQEAAQTPSPNVIVAGLPFEFRESGARAIVAADGRALWLSPAAQRIVETSRTISLVEGKLAGRTRHVEELIRSMISEAIQRCATVDQLVSTASGEPPELFLKAQNRSRNGHPVVAITIRELARDMEGLPDLTRLFRLTRTEDKIVRMLLQGHSVRGIAAKLGTSVLTVRTHLKRTYSKVNVGTKEQLFSTILKLMVD
jgi:DNA-binding CsgD family transcriptional regulator